MKKEHDKLNLEIIEQLEALSQIFPELRFGQLLQNFGFIKPERPARDEMGVSWTNEFYTEPEEILARVKQRIEDYERQ